MYNPDEIVKNVEKYIKSLSDGEFFEVFKNISFMTDDYDSNNENEFSSKDNKFLGDSKENSNNQLLYDGSLFNAFIDGYNCDDDTTNLVVE